MTIGIFFLFITLFLGVITINCYISGIRYRKIFGSLAKRYNGTINFFGVLTIPVDGNQVTFSHIQSRFESQIIVSFLELEANSQEIGSIENFHVYTALARRKGIHYAGMEKLLTNNTIFDKEFIVVRKNNGHRKLEGILNSSLQEKIINMRKNTDWFDISKNGSRMVIKYEKLKIENDAELHKIFGELLEIYRAMEV